MGCDFRHDQAERECTASIVRYCRPAFFCGRLLVDCSDASDPWSSDSKSSLAWQLKLQCFDDARELVDGRRLSGLQTSRGRIESGISTESLSGSLISDVGEGWRPKHQHMTALHACADRPMTSYQENICTAAV